MEDHRCIMSDETTITVESPNPAFRPDAARGTACLVQYSGSKVGRRYPLTDPLMVVGRLPTVQIAINDLSVSRQHARFVLIGDHVMVEDIGSSNGTFLNDVRLTGRSELADGDIVRFGTVLFRFFARDNVDGILHDRMYRMATIDAGTDVFNKQYLLDTLDTEFRFSRTYDRALSIIYYDLDHFKPVNDTYGHNAGDHILRESAGLVKSAVRKDDVLGRFGGEEFVIILPNTGGQMAAELAERIRQAHEGHQFLLEHGDDGARTTVPHRQTISMGVAALEPAMGSAKDLLEAADRKVYASKSGGRNRVTM